MTKKQLLLLVALLAVIIIVGVVIIVTRSEKGSGTQNTQNDPLPQGVRSETWEEVAATTEVPEKGEADLSADIASPIIVAPANPNTNAQFRSFDLRAQGGEFIPSIVAVYRGDTVHINVNSPDAAIDFTQPDYGLKVQVPRGETKVIEFGATAAGRFTFFCQSCGGPDEGPKGYIDVVVK